MSQYDMTYGYPALADINTYFAACGFELPVENNPNYFSDEKRKFWSIFNALGWARPLGVWCPTSTTFNVRSGDYLWDNEVKTFTAGSAVDPTDNDTTYIWIDGANAIGSGVDGDGWPACDHFKLAEIDVDSDGVITDIRDLRGRNFLFDPKTAVIKMTEMTLVFGGEVLTYNGEILIC